MQGFRGVHLHGDSGSCVAADAAGGAVAVGACVVGVTAECGLLVLFRVVLLGRLVPLDVLCIFCLVWFVIGVRIVVASFGLVADVMGCHMLPNAVVADLVLANVARRVRNTLGAFAGVACHAEGRLLMPLVTSFAKKIASPFMENHLVLDPLEAFWIRCDQHWPFVFVDLQVFYVRPFGGDSASWLRYDRLCPVGRQQGFRLFGDGTPGLRSSYRSVVYRIDEV